MRAVRSVNQMTFSGVGGRVLAAPIIRPTIDNSALPRRLLESRHYNIEKQDISSRLIHSPKLSGETC